MQPLIDRISDDSQPENAAPRTALVIGNLDGVHRGHQAIVAQAVQLAQSRSLVPALLTFDPHPAAVVGGEPPLQLTTLDRKAELVGRLGVTHVFARAFTKAFSAWTAERFVRDLVVARLHASAVFVGENFRFGAGRSGDAPRLRALGGAGGFETSVCALLHDTKGALSSSRVREAIAAGDIEDAAATLGRWHSVAGRVVAGDRRGRTLGFPTANLDDVVEAPPKDGVYAVAVDTVDAGVPRSLATGVMNLGVRPTVTDRGRRTLEVHLFDLDRDLYGVRLRVHFVARLRDEKKLGGLDALKAQIALDTAQARAALANVRVGPWGAYG